MSSTSYIFYYNHLSNLYYTQEKEYPQQIYYYLPQEQLQNMNFNHNLNFTQNVYPNYAYELFPLESSTIENVLQDDNFSIATASELYYNNNNNNNSPSLLSTTPLSPYSSPSPQISAVTGDNAAAYYEGNYNSNYATPELFAPVQTSTNKAKKASNNDATPIEKRHICPICSHRSKRRHNLVEHMLTHNPLRPKSFLCGHCSRPFARKYDMKRHEKIHTR